MKTSKDREINLKFFFTNINYKFKNFKFLNLSLIYSSYDEKNKILNYERLEFLGDRVLGLVISELLFEKFPLEKEGELSKRFSNLVSKKTLVKISYDINLSDFILTSKSYSQKYKITDSMLADSLEALIGAIFLDSNYKKVKEVVKSLWKEKINTQIQPPNNPKSQLQEWCLTNKKNLPKYSLIYKKGPDHLPHFKVKVEIKNFFTTYGSGRTKREAELVAAEKIVTKINEKSI